MLLYASLFAVVSKPLSLSHTHTHTRIEPDYSTAASSSSSALYANPGKNSGEPQTMSFSEFAGGSGGDDGMIPVPQLEQAQIQRVEFDRSTLAVVDAMERERLRELESLEMDFAGLNDSTVCMCECVCVCVCCVPLTCLYVSPAIPTYSFLSLCLWVCLFVRMSLYLFVSFVISIHTHTRTHIHTHTCMHTCNRAC